MDSDAPTSTFQLSSDLSQDLGSGGKFKTLWPELSRIRIHRLWVSRWHSAHPIWRTPADKNLAPGQLCSAAALDVHWPSSGSLPRVTSGGYLRNWLVGWPGAIAHCSNFGFSSKPRGLSLMKPLVTLSSKMLYFLWVFRRHQWFSSSVHNKREAEPLSRRTKFT